MVEDNRYRDLIIKFREKAQGVFLWVFFAVRSLSKGFTNDDTIPNPQKRLSVMPSDLEDYFRRMLASTEKEYHAQTARILQMCLAAHRVPSPISLLTLSFYDGVDHLKLPSEGWTIDKMSDINQKIWMRVNARCVDLVEVSDPEDTLPSQARFCVIFIHRTVHDFLETDDIQKMLRQWQGSDFKVDEWLIEAYLAQIGLAPTLIRPHHEALLFHVSCVERGLGSLPSPWLEELSKLCIGARQGLTELDIARFLPDASSPIYKVIPGGFARTSIVALSFKRDLAKYVALQLREA